MIERGDGDWTGDGDGEGEGGGGGGGGGEPERMRMRPGKHRALQVARTGARKLFDEAAQVDFLEWLAATGNVCVSAKLAGFNYKTMFRHRMNDARFADGWRRAIEQSYARVEAKLLETKAGEAPIGIEGDRDAPEMEEKDPQLMLALLRLHKEMLAGTTRVGRTPRVASNAEVNEALAARLKAFYERVRSEECGLGGAGGEEGAGGDGAGGARSLLDHPAAPDGPPPRPGEDER
jgi:hypothetical protein